MLQCREGGRGRREMSASALRPLANLRASADPGTSSTPIMFKRKACSKESSSSSDGSRPSHSEGAGGVNWQPLRCREA